MTNMTSPTDKRYEILLDCRKNNMQDLGFVRVYKALSSRLLSQYDQDQLFDNIMRALEEFGVCPSCLREMGTVRKCDAAGSMNDEYLCKNCPGHIDLVSERGPGE